MVKKHPCIAGLEISASEFLFMLLAFAAAAVLLFANLGEIFLWQDEASTAVLGERMFKYGKPLAYDGKNLITMDHFAQEKAGTIGLRTGDAQKAIQFYINRGDFKPDTTWVGQPWGQFLIAGASLSLLGHDTLSARLPFALASLLTVILFYFFIRNNFQDRTLASLAVIFLITNVYWILHGRQCRYYPLTGLALVLSFAAYNYWQEQRKCGGLLFIMAATALFHVDYGTFWPVIFVFLAVSFWLNPDRLKENALISVALALLTAPFILYYGIMDRLQVSTRPWQAKFLMNLFYVDRYMIPLALFILAAILFIFKFQRIPELQRRILLSAFLILVISLLWITSVTPSHFYRYIVHLTLLTSLVLTWVILTSCRFLFEKRKILRPNTLAFAAAGLMVLVPLPVHVVSWSLPYDKTSELVSDSAIRPELFLLWDQIFGNRTDPNRAAIETIKARAMPEDEILVNYEDIPFMFYTENKIRGGIPCFRCEDRSSPPQFLVLRASVMFSHWPVYIREKERHSWTRIPTYIPDIPFGNNPDPWFSHTYKPVPEISVFIAERVSEKTQ